MPRIDINIGGNSKAEIAVIRTQINSLIGEVVALRTTIGTATAEFTKIGTTLAAISSVGLKKLIEDTNSVTVASKAAGSSISDFKTRVAEAGASIATGNREVNNLVKSLTALDAGQRAGATSAVSLLKSQGELSALIATNAQEWKKLIEAEEGGAISARAAAIQGDRLTASFVAQRAEITANIRAQEQLAAAQEINANSRAFTLVPQTPSAAQAETDQAALFRQLSLAGAAQPLAITHNPAILLTDKQAMSSKAIADADAYVNAYKAAIAESANAGAVSSILQALTPTKAVSTAGKTKGIDFVAEIQAAAAAASPEVLLAASSAAALEAALAPVIPVGRETSEVLKDISKGSQLVLGPLSGVTSRITALSSLLTAGNVALAGFVIGVAAISVAIFEAAKKGAELESELFRLQALLKLSGDTTNITVGHLDNLAVSLSHSTLAIASDIRSAEGIVLSFGSITGTTFDRTIKLSNDLARIGFGGVAEEARLLSKAMTDPIQSLEALTRQLGKIDPSARRTIEGLSASGQSEAARNAILDLVSNRVGGAATNEATGLKGTLHESSVAIGDFFRAVGQAGVVDTLNDKLKELNSTLKDNPDLVHNAGTTLSFFITLTADSLKVLAGTLEELAAPFIFIADRLKEIKDAFKEFGVVADARKGKLPGIDIPSLGSTSVIGGEGDSETHKKDIEGVLSGVSKFLPDLNKFADANLKIQTFVGVMANLKDVAAALSIPEDFLAGMVKLEGIKLHDSLEASARANDDLRTSTDKLTDSQLDQIAVSRSSVTELSASFTERIRIQSNLAAQQEEVSKGLRTRIGGPVTETFDSAVERSSIESRFSAEANDKIIVALATSVFSNAQSIRDQISVIDFSFKNLHTIISQLKFDDTFGKGFTQSLLELERVANNDSIEKLSRDTQDLRNSTTKFVDTQNDSIRVGQIESQILSSSLTDRIGLTIKLAQQQALLAAGLTSTLGGALKSGPRVQDEATASNLKVQEDIRKQINDTQFTLVRSQREELDTIKLQSDDILRSSDGQRLNLALLKERQQIDNDIIGKTEEQRAQLLFNAVVIEKSNILYERQKQAISDLRDFASQAFGSIGTLIDGLGTKVKGGFKAQIDALFDDLNKQLAKFAIQLAIVNPILNRLPGATHATDLTDIIGLFTKQGKATVLNAADQAQLDAIKATAPQIVTAIDHTTEETNAVRLEVKKLGEIAKKQLDDCCCKCDTKTGPPLASASLAGGPAPHIRTVTFGPSGPDPELNDIITNANKRIAEANLRLSEATNSFEGRLRSGLGIITSDITRFAHGIDDAFTALVKNISGLAGNSGSQNASGVDLIGLAGKFLGGAGGGAGASAQGARVAQFDRSSINAPRSTQTVPTVTLVNNTGNKMRHEAHAETDSNGQVSKIKIIVHSMLDEDMSTNGKFSKSMQRNFKMERKNKGS